MLSPWSLMSSDFKALKEITPEKIPEIYFSVVLTAKRPEPILDALVRALKPGGQMVLTELTCPEPLNPNDPTVRRWAELLERL